MKTKHTLITLSLLASGSLAQAATIAWTNKLAPVENNFGTTLSSGLFDNSETLIFAQNSGSSAASTNFDNINFTAGTASGGINFGQNVSAFHQNNQNLSHPGTFSSTRSTVSLTGLISDQTYRVQALIFDGRGGTSGRTVQFDNLARVRFANGNTPQGTTTWGPGLLFTGTFKADAATQDFEIEIFESGPSGTSAGSQLNAITLHSIPEPSSTALLGLGGIALLLRRRK